MITLACAGCFLAGLALGLLLGAYRWRGGRHRGHSRLSMRG